MIMKISSICLCFVVSLLTISCAYAQKVATISSVAATKDYTIEPNEALKFENTTIFNGYVTCSVKAAASTISLTATGIKGETKVNGHPTAGGYTFDAKLNDKFDAYFPSGSAMNLHNNNTQNPITASCYSHLETNNHIKTNK